MPENVLKLFIRIAKEHPLIAQLGALGILVFLTFTAGKFDNSNFISILLALLGVSFALFHTFAPVPSMRRGIVALFLLVIWTSLLLNEPYPLRREINQLLDQRAIASAATQTASSSSSTQASMGVTSPSKTQVPAETEPISPTRYQSFPIHASSGSINVDCGKTGTAAATFTIPADGILESASASWVNTSNLSSVEQSTTQSGSNIVANGRIRGLDHQNIFGILNCPGGGHGTLVLSGSYKVPVR